MMELSQEQKDYLKECYQIDADTCDVDFLCNFLMNEIERKKKLIELDEKKLAIMKQSNEELRKLLIDKHS